MNIKIIKEPTTFRYISIDREATDEKLFDLNAEDIKQLEEQLKAINKIAYAIKKN